MSRNVDISISASWLSASWIVSELVCLRVVHKPLKLVTLGHSTLVVLDTVSKPIYFLGVQEVQGQGSRAQDLLPVYFRTVHDKEPVYRCQCRRRSTAAPPICISRERTVLPVFNAGHVNFRGPRQCAHNCAEEIVPYNSD